MSTPTKWKVRTPPRAWNIGKIGDRATPEPPAPLELTYLDLRPAGDRHARFSTGIAEAVALIYTNIPDGKDRLVGCLQKYELEAILKNWPED